MARPCRRTRRIQLALPLVGLAFAVCIRGDFLGGRAFVVQPFPGRWIHSRVALGAEANAGQIDSSASLAKLERALEAEIVAARDSKNPTRLRDLARLLVLAKTAEGIAVGAVAKEATVSVRQAITGSLESFVGKKDYAMQDVTREIMARCKSGVDKLDDIYLEDIAKEIDLVGQAAVASFTGKEEYEFGDITKTVNARATEAVKDFTGKEKYEFGDITQEALRRGGDAVKSFTGKDEYKFGDITKTVLKNIFGGGDK